MNDMCDFGQGFTYCIGLFLAHADRKDSDGRLFWFNGAADHLSDLEVPDNFSLNKECKEWQYKCLNWRLEKYTPENKEWAINQAKNFLLEWDKNCNINSEVADYS